MHRFLIALAIVVGVLTLSAVGFMIHKSKSASQTAVVAPSDEPAIAAAPTKPAKAARPRLVQNAPVAAEAASDEAAEPAVKPTAAVTGSLDVAAFVEKLTPDEEKALGAALMARFMQKRMQDRRYQLPINRKFSNLDNVDPKLALSAAQQTKLDTVMQGLKPQMDATFKDTWAQQDQLRTQMTQAFATATDREQVRQQTDSIRQQLTALNTAMQPQQDAFNQQVMSAMTPFLTPEQVQAINTMPADTGRGGFGGLFGGGPPNGGGDRRGGRNGGGGGGGNPQGN